MPGIITTNSSPPHRATMSSSRTALRNREPTTRSISSPAWWPYVSLTILNPLRSNSSRQMSVPCRSALAIASARATLELAAVGQLGERVEACPLEQAALLGDQRCPGEHEQHDGKREDQHVELALALRQVDCVGGPGDDPQTRCRLDLDRGLADAVLDRVVTGRRVLRQDRRRPDGNHHRDRRSRRRAFER